MLLLTGSAAALTPVDLSAPGALLHPAAKEQPDVSGSLHHCNDNLLPQITPKKDSKPWYLLQCHLSVHLLLQVRHLLNQQRRLRLCSSKPGLCRCSTGLRCGCPLTGADTAVHFHFLVSVLTRLVLRPSSHSTTPQCNEVESDSVHGAPPCSMRAHHPAARAADSSTVSSSSRAAASSARARVWAACCAASCASSCAVCRASCSSTRSRRSSSSSSCSQLNATLPFSLPISVQKIPKRM